MITARERRGGRVALGVAIGLLASLVLASAASAAVPYNLSGEWGIPTALQPEGGEGSCPNHSTIVMTEEGQISGTQFVSCTEFQVTGQEDSSGNVVIELHDGGYISYNEVKVGDNGECTSGSWHDTNGVKGASVGARKEDEATVVLVATGNPENPYECGPNTSSKEQEEAAAKEKEAAAAKEKEAAAAKEKEAAAAKEKEAKEKKEKESAGKRKSAVEVTCTINLDSSKPLTCTAQVGDATGGSPVEVPTGSVKFSTTLGSFLGSDTCTLAHSTSGNTSFCVVEYAPPPGQSIIETELPIKAAYAGDSNFNPSEGAFKLQEMGIEAEQFEDERINHESCEADNGKTAEVNQKTGEVTVPYTAPAPGTVETQIESGAGGVAASSSPLAESCTAGMTLELGGASASSYEATSSKAKKKSKKQKGKGKGKPKGTTIAKANIKVKAGPVKLHIRLNKAGKKLVALMKRKHEHAHITIRLQFKP